MLRRRKIRRKLLQDEKERLGQRRRFLSGRPEGDSVDTEDDRITVNEVKETPRKDDQIERNPDNKKQAFDNALERLKSLGKELSTIDIAISRPLNIPLSMQCQHKCLSYVSF